MTNLTIQQQRWSDFTRYLILSVGGSVQLDIYDTPAMDGTTAYIYGLWVEPKQRNKGIGRRLISQAEQIAEECGRHDVTLLYERNFTPVFVYEWYERRGYKTYRYTENGNVSVMSKVLNKKTSN